MTPGETIVANWTSRPAEYNDTFMRETYARLLAESKHMPPELKAVAYDPCDEHVATAPLSMGRRKRVDPRRQSSTAKV